MNLEQPLTFFLCCSRQIPYAHLAQRRLGSENHRSQIDNQIPVEESVVPRRSGWERGDDRGRADWEHHASHQLPGQLAEEGLAERRKLDYQS